MKIKIRSDDTSTLEESDWPQMNDWLAELRAEGRAEPTGDGHTQSAGGSDPWPEVLAEVAGHAEAVRAEAAAHAEAVRAEAVRAEAVRAEAAAHAEAVRAEAAAHAEAARAQASARAEITGRALIGDQLRMPIMWCEISSCISWHADPAALGEADTRARAISAGWRVDALGRLACPRCQQTDPGFWASRPVAVWDRAMAISRTGPITARPGDGTPDGAAAGLSHDPGRAASGYPPACRVAPEWHHDFPAAKAMPAARYVENPAVTSIPAARSSVRLVLASLRRPLWRHLAKPASTARI